MSDDSNDDERALVSEEESRDLLAALGLPDWRRAAEDAAAVTLGDPPAPSAPFGRDDVLALAGVVRPTTGTYREIQVFQLWELALVDRWRSLVLKGCGRLARTLSGGRLVLLTPGESVEYAHGRAMEDVARALRRGRRIIKKANRDEMTWEQQQFAAASDRTLGVLRLAASLASKTLQTTTRADAQQPPLLPARRPTNEGT